MSQPPAKQPPATTNNNDNTTTIDWQSVFPLGHIKTQIHNEDDNIGCLPKKTLQLISTCSALLLRKIVQTSVKSATNEKICSISKNNDDTSSPATLLLLSAQDIQRGIQQQRDTTLDIFKDVVDQAVQDDDRKLAYRLQTKKRKAPASSKAHSQGITGISKESLKQAVEISKEKSMRAATKEKVVLDEDDYD